MLPQARLSTFPPKARHCRGIKRRTADGVKIAATSRYQSVTAITLIATIVLVLAALPTGAVSRRAARLQAIVFGALLVCAVLIAIDRSYVANYAARNERKVVAEIAMRQDRRQSAPQSRDPGLCPAKAVDTHPSRRPAAPAGRAHCAGAGRGATLAGARERPGGPNPVFPLPPLTDEQRSVIERVATLSRERALSHLAVWASPSLTETAGL